MPARGASVKASRSSGRFAYVISRMPAGSLKIAPGGVDATADYRDDIIPAQELERTPQDGARCTSPSTSSSSSSSASPSAWAGFWLWFAVPWIEDLRRLDLDAARADGDRRDRDPAGDHRANLIASLLIDRPPPLRFDLDFPALTVVVACFKRRRRSRRRSTTSQAGVPGELHILIADDGSTDRPSVARQRGGRSRIVVLVDCTAAGADPDRGADARRDAAGRHRRRRHPARCPTSWSDRRPAADLPPDTVAVAGAVFVRNSRGNFLTRAQEWDYFLGIAAVKRQQGLFQGTMVAQGAFSVYRTAASPGSAAGPTGSARTSSSPGR